MDGLSALTEAIKLNLDQQQIVIDQITGGSVPDFAVYKYLRGKLDALKNFESELRALRKKAADSDD
jgi:hypothetical protein